MLRGPCSSCRPPGFSKSRNSPHGDSVGRLCRPPRSTRQFRQHTIARSAPRSAGVFADDQKTLRVRCRRLIASLLAEAVSRLRQVFALIGTCVRIETALTTTKQTIGVRSNRDILTSLRQSVLADFGAKFWRDLRDRCAPSVARSGDLRSAGVVRVCESHDVYMDSTRRGRAQRYGQWNYGWEGERRFQISDLRFQIEERARHAAPLRTEVRSERGWGDFKRRSLDPASSRG